MKLRTRITSPTLGTYQPRQARILLLNLSDDDDLKEQLQLFLQQLTAGKLVHHEHLLNLLNLLLQPLLQVVIMRAVTHLIVLTLLLQEQLQQMVREKSENIMNISEMK